nr:uncharacterized protein LOC118877085 isoform X2 [Drosophila suzukii]
MTDIEAGPEERSNSAAVQGTDQDDVGATSLDAQNNDETANNNMCVPEISMQLESLKRHLEVVQLENEFLNRDAKTSMSLSILSMFFKTAMYRCFFSNIDVITKRYTRKASV